MGTASHKPGVLYGARLATDTEYRYIGITVDLTKRTRTHRRHAAIGTDLPVYRWMRKHGVDAVIFDVLEHHPDRTSLIAAEVAMIADLRSSDAGLLNVTDGGDGGTGYRHTEKWKAAQRALPKEERNMSGLKHDLEHMRAMAKRAAATPWTPERRAAASERMRKRVHSPERNAKVAAAKRAYWERWRAERAEFLVD